MTLFGYNLVVILVLSQWWWCSCTVLKKNYITYHTCRLTLLLCYTEKKLHYIIYHTCMKLAGKVSYEIEHLVKVKVIFKVKVNTTAGIMFSVHPSRKPCTCTLLICFILSKRRCRNYLVVLWILIFLQKAGWSHCSSLYMMDILKHLK